MVLMVSLLILDTNYWALNSEMSQQKLFSERGIQPVHIYREWVVLFFPGSIALMYDLGLTGLEPEVFYPEIAREVAA